MDEEPIIGSLGEQYKIVGNGVDRKVAFAMGLALLQAVKKNDSGFIANGTTQNAAEVTSGSTSYSKSIAHEPLPAQSKQRNKSFGSMVLIPSRPRTVEITRGSDQQNPGLFSRVSKSLSASVGKLSLSSMVSSRPATIPMPMKRSREDDVEDSTTEGESVKKERERPSKQPRISETPSIDTVTTSAEEKSRGRSMSSRRHSRGSSASSTKTRQTRHSGLTVEFVPKNWNRRVEAETRESNFEEEFV
jgi:DNA (cytosine-5)-methyltransferase 1